MVLLLSALAVVAAAVLLAAWFVVGGGFGLLYAAMALAIVSMLLLWAARWIGSTTAPPLPVAPEPLPRDVLEVDQDEMIDLTAGFPIADYDHLWVTQIIPLLPQLDLDELAMVEARERGGRHRGGVLDAVDVEREAQGARFATLVLAAEDPDEVAGADEEMDASVPEPVHAGELELAGSGPRVRTFLGRPSGPITIRHG